MYQCTCVPIPISKNGNTFILLKAVSGQVPEKPYISLKQVEVLNIPLLDVSIMVFWKYELSEDETCVILKIIDWDFENWDFENTVPEIILKPTPEDIGGLPMLP